MKKRHEKTEKILRPETRKNEKRDVHVITIVVWLFHCHWAAATSQAPKTAFVFVWWCYTQREADRHTHLHAEYKKSICKAIKKENGKKTRQTNESHVCVDSMKQHFALADNHLIRVK